MSDFCLCIEGEHLECWARLLDDPDLSHHIFTYRNRHYLTSTEISAARDPERALELAEQIVGELNGIVAAYHQFAPLKTVGMGQRQPEGSIILRQSASLTANARAMAFFKPTGSARPTVLTLLDKVENNTRLADAAAYYGKASSWFDLYYVIEALCQHAGGEAEFKKSGWAGASATKLGKLKETANSHRHAYAREPDDKLSWRDAYRLTGELLISAIQTAPD